MRYLFNNSVAKCLVLLQELSVSSCDVMELIVMNEGTNDGDLITFPKLKSLKLLSLCSLKSFYGKKEDMFSSSISIIDIMDISDIPYVQPRPLFDETVAFPSLEELEISGLEVNISDIWGKNYYNNDNVFSSFGKLKRLNVLQCSGFKTVFLQYSSMTSDIIMHLEKMSIRACQMMQEIIGTGDQREITDNGILVFPELTDLKLVRLPRLSSLCCCRSREANKCKVKFPVLVNLEFEDLKNNLEAIHLDRDDSSCQLKFLKLSSNREIQFPSAWQLQLYDLESLTLRQGLSDVLKTVCIFKRLKVLDVIELKCSTLFSFPVLRSLQQLQKLEISNCSFLEDIVEDARDDEASGMDKNTTTLFYLRSVILNDLPNLRSFFQGANYELDMPALETVEVVNCGLSTLFTCSVFRKLQKLKYIRVSSCKLLEGIIAETRGIESSDTNDKIITLSQLYSVYLGNLPNLKSFSLAVSYALNMPKLQRFCLHSCPRVEHFTSLNTRTGMVNVYSDWHEGKDVPDLNDYIRQYGKIRDSVIHQPQPPLELKETFFSLAWSCPWAC